LQARRDRALAHHFRVRQYDIPNRADLARCIEEWAEHEHAARKMGFAVATSRPPLRIREGPEGVPAIDKPRQRQAASRVASSKPLLKGSGPAP
jgi:hypothetical protein